MTRPRLLLAAVVVVVLAWFGLKTTGVIESESEESSSESEPDPANGRRTIGSDFRNLLGRGAHIPWAHPQRVDGSVTISGTVIDNQSSQPVGNVEVVFRGPAGEETVMAGADGRYRIDVPSGFYRAFVRDETVLSIGQITRVRLPGMPSADTAGVPDEALMPLVAAMHDTDGVDLGVLRGGVVMGTVTDRAGRPVKRAVLRALDPKGIKPTLGTDVAETDDSGAFELRLPAGTYTLEATHPWFAGLAESAEVSVIAGDHVTRDLTLTAGCVIAGRVVGANGAAAGDGAIEKQWGDGDLEFRPDGKIGPDGSFRWVTTDEAEVTLRAWPWKSPPSPSRRFSCRDGARFDNVVFALPSRSPDIEGVLADASGAPVPLAYIDLVPLDPGGIPQQERTDADGKWSVFNMPAGRYSVTAYAHGRGAVSSIVTSPQTSVRLTLGGVGKIEGTSTVLANGSFELELLGCNDGVFLAIEDRRLVTVTAGRFVVDDVPACMLVVAATAGRHKERAAVTVAPNGVGQLELALGPARPKQVSGIVRDDAGRPVADAFVNAILVDDENGSEASTVTDSTGRYTIETYSGAHIEVRSEGRYGSGSVGSAKLDTETIDITLSPPPENFEHEEPPPDDEPLVE